jgi:hypothetical protein
MVLDRFPRMPHVPGSRAAHDDVHLDVAQTSALLAREVIVTEKLDGLRVEIARGRGARIHATLKPSYRGALDGGVERALAIWVAQREPMLSPLVQRGGAIYGEWLLHRLHVAYDALPDFFVAFALRAHDGRFVDNDRALDLLARAGVTAARPLARGVFTLAQVKALARRRSQYAQHGRARMEGVVVAACGAGPDACAKWVAPHYVHVARDEMTNARNAVRERRQPRS